MTFKQKVIGGVIFGVFAIAILIATAVGHSTGRTPHSSTPHMAVTEHPTSLQVTDENGAHMVRKIVSYGRILEEDYVLNMKAGTEMLILTEDTNHKYWLVYLQFGQNPDTGKPFEMCGWVPKSHVKVVSWR